MRIKPPYPVPTGMKWVKEILLIRIAVNHEDGSVENVYRQSGFVWTLQPRDTEKKDDA